MPKVTEASKRPTNGPVRPAAKPPRVGTVLSRATPVSEIKRAPLSLLIYGANRVGKTTLACQGEGPILLVSFEPSLSGGAESVRKLPTVEYLRIRNCAEARTLAEELSHQPDAFRKVVVDGATSAQEMVLCEIMNWDKMPDQISVWNGKHVVSSDQYRARSEQTRELLRPFLDLPMDKIILAKERDHNPPKEERVNERTGKVQPDMRPDFLRGVGSGSYFASDLGGATVGWLHDSCDAIVRLYADVELEESVVEMTDAKGATTRTKTGDKVATGRFARYLRIGYHPNYAAGIRAANPVNIPEVITASNPVEMYGMLMAVIYDNEA